MGGVHLHVRTWARAYVPPPFPVSRKRRGGQQRRGWTDCAEIWCMIRDPLARRFAKVYRVEYICTCAHEDVPLFYTSETAGRIALKLGVWSQTD